MILPTQEDLKPQRDFWLPHARRGILVRLDEDDQGGKIPSNHQTRETGVHL